MAAGSATIGRTAPTPQMGMALERALGPRRSAARWLSARPRVLIFGSMVLLMALVGLLAPVLTPYDPNKTMPADALQPPSAVHWLGTDSLGRDTMSRVLHGARISLAVSVIAVSIALIGGVSLGLIAGFWAGWADDVFSRIIDAMLAFPGILLAIAITAALGPSLQNAMIAVGIIAIPTYFRLTRGQVLQTREHDFVTAATVLGASRWRIIGRHILPNIANPLIIAASIASSGAILSLASLSFIGIGTQPPEADWGSMIFSAIGYLGRAPWLVYGPGIAIFLTVFSFYMLGDALRDALDPRLRTR